MNGVNGVAGSVAVLGAEAAQVLGVSQLGVEVAVHFTLTRRQTADRAARRLIQGHVLSFLGPHICGQAHSRPIIPRKGGLFTFSRATHSRRRLTRTTIVCSIIVAFVFNPFGHLKSTSITCSTVQRLISFADTCDQETTHCASIYNVPRYGSVECPQATRGRLTCECLQLTKNLSHHNVVYTDLLRRHLEVSEQTPESPHQVRQ